MRAEGLTEFAGDIVLTCTGGPPPTLGTTLPTANITVSFPTNVTSRLLGYNTATNPLTASNTSEPLLLIDEPGSGLMVAPPGAVGFGPDAPQTLCGSGGVPYSLVGAGAGGCVEYAQQAPQGDFVMSSSPASAVAGANVFAGVVSANQVTFYGIPIMPPASAGVARIFRMINMRVNASMIPGAPVGALPASLSISGNTSVPVFNPVPIVGFVQSGLAFQVRTPDDSAVLTAPNFSGCATGAACPYGMLRFSENFGTTFKTRVAPTVTTNGQSANPSPGQNIPGEIYNSESGFVFSGITGTSGNAVAGLADFGTRLKAEFSNVPTGVSIYVATTNVANVLAPTSSSSPTSFAQWVNSETAVDGDGTTPSGTAAGFIAWNGTPATYGYVQIPVVSGSGTAVWEVVNTNPAMVENFDFPVWIVYGSGVTPAAMNIAGYIAPNSDNGAFSASGGAAAQDTTYPLPRFTSAPPIPVTTTIVPSQAPNAGNVTVVISSNAFAQVVNPGYTNQVILSSTGLSDIPGTILSTGYDGTLPAVLTFNLAGAAPGVWDIVFWVTYPPSPPYFPGGTFVQASFPAAFTIVAAPPCTFQLGTSSAQYAVGGGSGQVVVGASSASCTWSASSDSSWLTVLSTTSSAILNYSVQTNPNSAQRVGHITVGGVSGPVLTVTQAGTATCTYAISPASQAFPASGGSGGISVTAASGCPWSVAGIPTWVSVVSGSSGSGNGTFNYTVAVNSGGPRSASVTVAGQAFSLSQGGSACGPATDVTSQMKATLGAFLGTAPLFQTFSQSVTLTNTGTAIAGPIEYVLDGLPRTSSPCPSGKTCTVTTPAPTTTYCQSTAGSAMVLMSSGGLAAGQSVSKTLTFTPGTAAGGSAPALQYTFRVLNGTPSN
jgi:hypothetical protein